MEAPASDRSTREAGRGPTRRSDTWAAAARGPAAHMFGPQAAVFEMTIGDPGHATLGFASPFKKASNNRPTTKSLGN